MLNLSKRLLVILLIVISIVFGTKIFSSFSQVSTDWSTVTFATHRNAYKFFDHSTGKLYVYSDIDGRLDSIWALEELGKDLQGVYQRK